MNDFQFRLQRSKGSKFSEKWPELPGRMFKRIGRLCSEEYTNTLCIRETGQNINNNNLFTLVFPSELLL